MNKFVLVILRGAVDGLAMVPAPGDPAYSTRGSVLINNPADLDGFFGLHPAMPALHGQYEAGEATLLHAIQSPYRDRSHFDGQKVLEQGGETIGQYTDGWLNRAITNISSQGQEAAIAIGSNPPLVLRGNSPVLSWSRSKLPEIDNDMEMALDSLYEPESFFSSRFSQAMRAESIGAGGPSIAGLSPIEIDFQTAANFLKATVSPSIAVVEVAGWDTHSQQGSDTGRLANHLGKLDEGLAKLKEQMGTQWEDTACLCVTEFGRTVSANGTQGTDHGQASVAILTGGAVKGGRVIADWPGLDTESLYEGRDLMPTMDLRSVFRSCLSWVGVKDDVFPGEITPQAGLFNDDDIEPPVPGMTCNERLAAIQAILDAP